MGSFKDFIQRKFGGSSKSPSIPSDDLNDEEGRAIAKALGARYLGFKKDSGKYWFDDKRYGSSYMGRHLEDSRKSRDELWQRFQRTN